MPTFIVLFYMICYGTCFVKRLIAVFISLYVVFGYALLVPLYLFEPDVISVIKLSYISSYFVTAVFFRALVDTCYFAVYISHHKCASLLSYILLGEHRLHLVSQKRGTCSYIESLSTIGSILLGEHRSHLVRVYSNCMSNITLLS